MELKWKSCLRAGVTVIILFLMIYYWTDFVSVAGIALGAAVPLFLGCVIAYTVNIPMTFIEKYLQKLCRDTQGVQKDQKRQQKKKGVRIVFPQKLCRPVSLVLALVSLVCIVFLVVRMIVPELLSCMQLLFRELPGVLQDTMQWLEDNLQISSYLEGENSLLAMDSMGDWQEWVTKLSSFVWSGLGGAMGVAAGIVSSVFSTTVTVVVGFIFALYLLAGKEKIGGQMTLLFRKYLPVKLVDKIFYVLHVFDGCFHSFIVGQCTEAVVLGVLCMAGMFLLRLPYAAMIGCLIGFTALIPVAGAYIGTDRKSVV